ncbi:hypothetical protein HPB49_020161 [Dermacentor silvarum]|uniref:Uncharacterized protein n=1 Tax=Dermacentor silvarum TaxID=543639 RepID=A0ACB8DJZ3_DERSI|nr:hypothetical protein HPB49_020161 [Dermacentor silvarum]
MPPLCLRRHTCRLRHRGLVQGLRPRLSMSVVVAGVRRQESRTTEEVGRHEIIGPVEVVAVTLYDAFDGQQQQQAPPKSASAPATPQGGGAGGHAASQQVSQLRDKPAAAVRGNGLSAPTQSAPCTPPATSNTASNQATTSADMPPLKEPKDSFDPILRGSRQKERDSLRKYPREMERAVPSLSFASTGKDGDSARREAAAQLLGKSRLLDCRRRNGDASLRLSLRVPRPSSHADDGAFQTPLREVAPKEMGHARTLRNIVVSFPDCATPPFSFRLSFLSLFWSSADDVCPDVNIKLGRVAFFPESHVSRSEARLDLGSERQRVTLSSLSDAVSRAALIHMRPLMHRSCRHRPRIRDRLAWARANASRTAF